VPLVLTSTTKMQMTAKLPKWGSRHTAAISLQRGDISFAAAMGVCSGIQTI
jgi:hypothetical protein